MDEDLEGMSREELPEFLRGCVRYRQSLDEQLPAAPRSGAPYAG